MRTIVANVFLVLVVMTYSASANTESPSEEYIEVYSWEPGDPVPVWIDAEPDLSKPHGMMGGIALSMVRFYQKSISVKSVSRCPFYISCSSYAVHAIKRKGLLLGLCYYVDRHFYRENPGMYLHYEYHETESGVLKLDDSFFILGE